MANLFRIIWTVVFAITVSIGRISALDDDNFLFTAPDDDRFPSTNFVPAKLLISDAVYDRLLVHLGDQLSAEDVAIPVNDYFPKEIESDEGDELQFVHEYNPDDDDDDEDDSADDDDDELTDNPLGDASVSTEFGRREFKFGRVLEIRKNGTKTFSKFRQSTKIGSHADTSVTGNYNTSLIATTSASGKFDVNSTYFSKGQQKNVVASGTVDTSSTSSSKVVKRRLFQRASANSSINLQIPTPVRISTSYRSGSETLKLPFRSYLTLFRADSNTTAENLSRFKTTVAGRVVSRVAFANKTVSLTKSCFRAYVKGRSINNDAGVVDDEDEAYAAQNFYQIALVKAKTHTWTKVVSQSKTDVVVDVITCAKTRIYGKSLKRGAFVIFTGSGQVSWEKSRITINAKRMRNLSPHEYGVHFIKKQLEGGSLIQLLGSSFEMK